MPKSSVTVGFSPKSSMAYTAAKAGSDRHMTDERFTLRLCWQWARRFCPITCSDRVIPSMGHISAHVRGASGPSASAPIINSTAVVDMLHTNIMALEDTLPLAR